MQTTPNSASRALRGLAAAFLALSPMAAAQERSELGLPSGQGDPRAELEALFKKVEKRLARMSDLLGQAGAGDTKGLAELGGAGIDELIREAERPPSERTPSGVGALVQATRGHGEELLKEIDRVLEIAREQAQQQQQQQSSSGGQQPPQSQGGQQPQQGQSPENSRQMSGEEGPRPGEQEREQQPRDGEDPRGNQDNPPVTPQQSGDAPPGAEIGAASGADEGGQWGDLPVHVRRVFRNGVSEDVPPRYRDWIDAYHKKLSRRGPR